MSDRTVLCVDDEPSILTSLKRLLRKEDYTVCTAVGAREGFAVLERQPVQVIISDQRMPDMSGTEFLQKVKEEYPDTVRVILSGYAEVHAVVESVNKGEIYRFLGKPWNDDELKLTIRQCLAHYDILRQNRSLLGQVRAQNEELSRLNRHLEETVEERTRSLRLSQEILDRLPVPVLGVDREGIVVFTNEAVGRTFPELGSVCLGADARDVFSEDVADMIAARMGEGTSGAPLPFTLQGQPVRLRMAPIGEHGEARGSILVMDRM